MLRPYAIRKEVLKKLGHDDYLSYLASPLWESIRSRVMANRACFCCGGHADQVHHSEYSEAVLSGEDDSKLYPVCHDCHEWAHTGNSSTLPPGLATARMKNARNRALLQQAAVDRILSDLPDFPDTSWRKPRKRHDRRPRIPGRRLAGTLMRSSMARRADAAPPARLS